MKTCFALLAIALFHSVRGASWDYATVNEWNTLHPDFCGGSEQSPIDIITEDTVYDAVLDLGHIFGEGMGDSMGNASFSNNGHTYQVDVPASLQPDLSMRGAGLSFSDYKLLQFHFHFGTINNPGSEHRINGHQYPAEVHFVFQSPSAENDSNVGRDYAVLGFFIEEDTSGVFTHAGPVGDLFDKILDIEITGDAVFLEGILSVRDLIPLYNLDIMKTFYHYSGGLTTPTCDERVQWFVFEHPLYISSEQYQKFLSGKDSNGNNIMDNFRPPQPLNGRVVKRTKLASSATSFNDFTAAFTCIVTFLVTYIVQ